jgi:type VI secretion system lysozyme-like protein
MSSLIDKFNNENENIDDTKALIRDIYNLFNSKKFFNDNFLEFKEISSSVLNYGLKSFSEYEASSSALAENIKKQLVEAITLHEPRLKDVEITITKIEMHNIAFTISAIFSSDPDPIKIEFDSIYKPDIQEVIEAN